MRSILILSFMIVAVWATADQPKTRVIEGVVTDQKGKPIKGAAVEWGHFQSGRQSREIFRTDNDGHYRVETKTVGPDFRLGVSASGYAPTWRDGLIPRAADEHQKIDFKLSRPITLKGFVVDNAGAPIAGVTVIAKSPTSGFYSSFSEPTPSFPYPGPQRQGITDSDGRFTIRNLPTSITIAKDGNRGNAYELSIETATGVMPRGKGYSKEDNKLTVNRSYIAGSKAKLGEISAEVIDAVTKKPITKFKHVHRHRPEMIDHDDPNGKFMLTGLALGSLYQIWVYADGYEPFVFRVPASSSSQSVLHKCKLTPSPSFDGDIVDTQGRPIKDAEVVVGVQKSKHSANRFYWGAFEKLVDGYMGLEAVQRMTTAADGQFAFCQGKLPGQVAVIAPGYARRFLSVAEREKMMKDGRLPITLQKESVLRGQVLLNGKPEPNARLRLSRKGKWELDFGELKADEDGKFEIRNLVPDEYQFSVYQYAGSKGTVRLCKRIDLKPAETKTVTMDNPGGSCTLSGKASPFWLIVLTSVQADNSEAEYPHIGTISDADGRYRIEGLRAGKYNFRATNPSRLSRFPNDFAKEVTVDGFTIFNTNGPVVPITLQTE